MTITATPTAAWTSDRAIGAEAVGRNSTIDTMRGLAILMVMGIHSLPQPLDGAWKVWLDAALRPCVPLFLFATGYLTARSGRVPLVKRMKAVLIPYAIAFVAAYAYMTLHNPAMDHRITVTVARFLLAYVFVYYYVFVYVGCTLGLWLIFRQSDAKPPHEQPQLVIMLLLAILLGLLVGSYLDPLLFRLGFSSAVIEEVRMRDVAFWLSFAAVGALLGTWRNVPASREILREMRRTIVAFTLICYAIYAAVRLFGIGDAADYESVAFFGYAATLCVLLFTFDVGFTPLAALGSGSYFLYLWHIFVVMMLRDHTTLRNLDAATGAVITFVVTAAVSILALLAVRRLAPPRIIRWLGA